MPSSAVLAGRASSLTADPSTKQLNLSTVGIRWFLKLLVALREKTNHDMGHVSNGCKPCIARGCLFESYFFTCCYLRRTVIFMDWIVAFAARNSYTAWFISCIRHPFVPYAHTRSLVLERHYFAKKHVTHVHTLCHGQEPHGDRMSADWYASLLVGYLVFLT